MDLEQEATVLGWTPKDQFKGDPEKWIDAETFVRRGKEVLPILRKNNEKLLGTLNEQKKELFSLKTAFAEAREALTTLTEYHSKTAEREYERARQELLGKKATAMREGEFEVAVKIDEELKDLNADAPKEIKLTPKEEAKESTPSQHPDYAAWASDNSEWLGKDKAKTQYATSVAHYIRAMEPTLVGRAFLDKVTEEVELKFSPPKEEKGKKEVPSKVASGARGTFRNGKSFGDLPKEAQEACNKFGARLVGENKAYKTMADWQKQYVANYDWE